MSKDLLSPARITYNGELSSPQQIIPNSLSKESSTLLTIIKSNELEIYEKLKQFTQSIYELLETDNNEDTLNIIIEYLNYRHQIIFDPHSSSSIQPLKEEIQYFFEEIIRKNKLNLLITICNNDNINLYITIRPGALIAIENNFTDILEFLISYEITTRKFSEITVPILVDVNIYGLTEVIEAKKYIINIILPIGETTFTYSVKAGYINTALNLIKYGANPDILLDYNYTLLMSLSENGSLSKIRFLIEECGATVVTKPYTENSAIKFALQYNHIEVAKYLYRKHPKNTDNVTIDLSNIIDVSFNQNSPEFLYYLIFEENIHIENNILSKLFWHNINKRNIEKAQYIIDNMTREIEFDESCPLIFKKLILYGYDSVLEFLSKNKIFKNIKLLEAISIEYEGSKSYRNDTTRQWYIKLLRESSASEITHSSESLVQEKTPTNILETLRSIEDREFNYLVQSCHLSDAKEITRYKQQKRQIETYGTYSSECFETINEVLRYEEFDRKLSNKKMRTSFYISSEEVEEFLPIIPPEYDLNLLGHSNHL